MDIDAIKEKFAKQLDRFSELKARIKFDMGEDGSFVVDGRESPATITASDEESECTIVMSKDNLGKMISGDLNPMMAFTLGKLKIEGSMGLAMKLSSLLED